MSSFFTLPASQKKRKRTDSHIAAKKSAGPRRNGADDDSISGSDASDDAAERDDFVSEDEEEDIQDEDPAAKRVRLAEQYLANTQREVLEDGGFDAAEVDKENLRRRMGDRLKEDTAESKGKLYRWIADQYDWRNAEVQICRRLFVTKAVTGIAAHDGFVYAVTKDLNLLKMELPNTARTPEGRRSTTQAKVVARTRGKRNAPNVQHHTAAILCVAVSPDGKFLATGGADQKLIIWDAESLKPLKVFPQHRDSVTALAFRRGTNQLYSASKDRTIKIWSLNELAYVESLFGHQDEIVNIDALGQEKCVTVGARDRTARLWKVVEEAQLVFRGGSAGTTKAIEKLRHAYEEGNLDTPKGYSEGSIDCIAMVDDDTFVTGSDNGSLSLWNIHKKKAVYTLPLAHGVDPALPLDQASADQFPDDNASEDSRGGKQARWITALKALPFSDVIVSGSWDGHVRVWKVSKDKRKLEPLGAVCEQVNLSNGASPNGAEDESHEPVVGVFNDLAIIDQGERGKEGILIAAAVGKEHRLGRWREIAGGKNCVALYRVPLSVQGSEDTRANGDGNSLQNDDGFEGFD